MLVFGVIAAINDLYAAVVITAVFGTNIGETALEGMVQAGDFVPGTQVAVAIKTGDWLNVLRKACAAGQGHQPGYQGPFS